MPEPKNDGGTGGVSPGAVLDTDPWRPGVQNLYAIDERWQGASRIRPGEAIRIIAEFDRAGLHVRHCHVLSHQDNEMIRPFHVSGPAMPVG